MALYQPTMISPDVRGFLGNGVIDSERTWSVSWRVNGASALTAFQISIFENTEAGNIVYTTGQITDGCPFYGTDETGAPKTFSYRMPAVGAMENGNSYRLSITQWWSSTESITQNSESVFYCRANPYLSINPIGTNGVVDNKEYTFTATYAQEQGDILNWFRWRVAPQNDLNASLYDTGDVFGTMDIRMTYDGLFTGQSYAVRLEAQTSYGVSMDTGWQVFSVDYGVPTESTDVAASCVDGTNAVLVSWTEMADVSVTLVTPNAINSLVYDGTEQTQTWNNYDSEYLTMGGVTAGTQAGTYTATFTPKPGYQWGINHMGATAWAIYRLDADGRFIHLTDVPATKGQLYDYGAASMQGPYRYYIFPIQEQDDGSGNITTIIMSPPIYSNSVSPCFASWSLMECEESANGGYRVLTEYLFKYNFSSSSMSNNNKPSIEQNFTRYPTYFRAPQNYKSGSLTSLIGVVDRARYSDTLSLRDRIFALSTTKNKLFLKSKKGDVLYVGLSDSISATTADKTLEQTQTVTIPWVEIGDSSTILKITALENVSTKDGGQKSPNLVLDPDFVALNIGESFTATASWDGGGALSVMTPRGVLASINGEKVTVTATTAGRTTIDVSVSPSGEYVGQTVPFMVETISYQVIQIPYTSSVLPYNGSSQSPVWTNYNAGVMTISGETSGINAGSYVTRFMPKPGYMWVDGTTTQKSIAWSIAKISPNLAVSLASVTVQVGQQADLDVTFDGDGIITVSSTDPTVATANAIDSSSATQVNPPTQRNTLYYNGNSQLPLWNGYNSSVMTISGTTTAVEPGQYGAVFTLADGYVWAGSESGWIVTVDGVGSGNATITVTVSETTNYISESVTVPVTVTT